mgnify:FL=1
MESKKLEQMKADFRGIIKRGPFYQGGAHAKTLGDALWNIDREGVFADAVEEGYLDLCRTCHGIEDSFNKGNTTGEKYCCVRRAVFERLADKIAQVFSGVAAVDFDACHRELCQSFMNDMAQMLHYQVTFGHAQKIVNMAFKYLYCCHGAEKYEDTVFSRCHMPLDSYTIANYRKCITKEDTIPGWSKFDTPADRRLYEKIQTNVRKYSEEHRQTPLYTEFVWWRDGVQKAAKKN